MKKMVLFVLLEQFADWEAAYLSTGLNLLGQGHYEVKTVSLTKDLVRSIGGFQVMPDYDIQSVPTEYEAVILIGGAAWKDENAFKIKPLAEHCIRMRRLLGGICAASAFLGAIGALNSAYHTSNTLEDLKRWAGEQYTGDERYLNQQAVSDKNIITANGTAALEFAREVLLALKAAPDDKINGWYRFHKSGCYDSLK